MTKKFIGAAGLTAAALFASAAQASDGTITIDGEITAQTCVVVGNGQGNNFTVTLPKVQTGAFKAQGDTAGRTAFVMALTNCQPGDNVAAFFEMGATVDAVTGRLKNMTPGGAANVQVQLLNDDGTAILVGRDVATQGSKPVAIAADGTATLVYAAQYIASSATLPTAGLVNTTVVYSLTYS